MNVELSILEKILEWSKPLPMWQRDALRRLFQNGELNDQDKADLRLMLLKEHGLEATAPSAIPFDRTHLPASTDELNVIRLVELSELKGVNALTEGHTLTFAKNGLTIIYGENGAGKSGYARVLKSACRARDIEPIIPDVKNPTPTPATALITVSIGEGEDEKTEPLTWPNGDAEGKLKQFSVFDSACALRIIKDPAAPELGPTGLEVFEPFVAMLDDLKKKLVAEANLLKERHEGQLKSLRTSLKGAHAVGQLLEAFPKDVTPSVIEGLSKLSPQEREELGGLEIKLAGLKANDPALVLRRLEALQSRCATERKRLTTFAQHISPEVILDLQEAKVAVTTAEQAAELAAQVAMPEEPLAGVGSESWKSLFAAARAYSVEHAYVGRDFPATNEGDQCVLCMQPLQAEARERLARFERFVQDYATKSLVSARTQLSNLLSPLNAATLSPLDLPLGSELDTEQSGLQRRLVDLISSMSVTQKVILAAVDTGMWDSIPSLDLDPLQDLVKLEASLAMRVTQLKGPVDRTEELQIQLRIDELKARQKLAPHVAVLMEHLENLSRAAKLITLAEGLSGTSVTNKGKALAKEAMEGRYGKALQTELTGLSCDFLSLDFKLEGAKGKALQRLHLADAKREYGPEKVLSEGEQRVAAIAAFLAEVQLLPVASGIILDDPVSSLDHHWAKKIVKRLVQEANRRQVVIFTHHISFLMELIGAVEDTEPPLGCLVQTIHRVKQKPGTISSGVPEEGMRVKARVNELERLLADAKRTFKDDPGGDTYHSASDAFYSYLRKTWEKVVEEELLSDVIKPFRVSVETQRLRSVVVADEDHKAIYRGMKRSSGQIPAHAKPDAQFQGHDDPLQLEERLSELKSYRTDLKTRKGLAEKNRALFEGRGNSLLGTGELH